MLVRLIAPAIGLWPEFPLYHLVIGWNDDNFEDEDEETETLENYYADCTGTWEEITEEEYNEEG